MLGWVCTHEKLLTSGGNFKARRLKKRPPGYVQSRGYMFALSPKRNTLHTKTAQLAPTHQNSVSLAFDLQLESDAVASPAHDIALTLKVELRTSRLTNTTTVNPIEAGRSHSQNWLALASQLHSETTLLRPPSVCRPLLGCFSLAIYDCPTFVALEKTLKLPEDNFHHTQFAHDARRAGKREERGTKSVRRCGSQGSDRQSGNSY